MRFVAIDYVNDQCDMTTQSEAEDGAPDAIVEYTASYIVTAASQLINNEKLSKKYTIWLEDASIEIRGLGISPDVLTQATSKILSSRERSETAP